MPRKTGISQETLSDYLQIKQLADDDTSSARAIADKTSFSRSKVYRGLRYFNIHLQRKANTTRPFMERRVELQVDPEWASIFRGFFYGEGHITIQDQSQNWRPIMTINLRVDDEAITHDIQAHLGGSVAFRKRSGKGQEGHSQSRWTATGWNHIRAIIEQCGFLDDSFPSKKHKEFLLVYEAILARSKMKYHHSEKDRQLLEDYHLRLIKTRLFRYSG